MDKNLLTFIISVPLIVLFAKTQQYYFDDPIEANGNNQLCKKESADLTMCYIANGNDQYKCRDAKSEVDRCVLSNQK